MSDISSRRQKLDAERREYQRKVMADFDKEWHAKLAALQAECPHKYWPFSHFGPLGNAWYVCAECGKTQVEECR